MLNNANDVRANFHRRQQKHRLYAFLLVMPLFAYLMVFFVLPLSAMMLKSFYHPKVTDSIPKTAAALSEWTDLQNLPGEETYRFFAQELKILQKENKAGALAEELNRSKAGLSSLIKRAARQIGKENVDAIPSLKDWFANSNSQWLNPEIWYGIKIASKVITPDYFLKSLDTENTINGLKVSENKLHIPIAIKTLFLSITITLSTFLLAYPTAYFLSRQPESRANWMMVFVLLPFWTSLLVRTSAWIVLLQDYGVINSIFLALEIIEKPIPVLYTRYATLIAMTHVLLPFMILPIYSVMRKMDNSVINASHSMGAPPMTTFLKVYFPLTLPGVSAGGLLVFIISIGYYITPALVGGVDGQMFSNLVAFHMQVSNNWELASALGSALLTVVLACYFIYDKLVGVNNLRMG